MRGKKISVIMIAFVCLSILTACGNNKGAGDFSFEVVNEKQVYDISNPAGYTVDEEGTIYTLTYQKGSDFEGIELGMYDLEGNLKEKYTLDNSLELCSELKLIKKIAVKGKELYIVLDNVGVLELYTYNLKTKAEEYVQTFAGYTQIYNLIPVGKSLYFSGIDANEAEVFGYMDLKKKAIHTVEAEEFCTVATDSGVTTDSVSKGVLCVGKQVFYQNNEKQLSRMSLEEYIKEKNRPNTYMEMGTKEDWQAAEKTGIDEEASINLKIDMGMAADYGALPICHNEVYDAIYYIDYSDNGYIYRCKNNEVRLAVKIPAGNLYVKDGDLYFMVKEVYEGLTGVSVGDICKYSPVTGAVEKVIGDMGASRMTVSDAGIYYSYLEPAKQVTIEGKTYSVRTPHSFYYSFEEKKSKEVKGYPDFILWKDELGIVSCYTDPNGFNGLGLYKIGNDVLDVEPIITGARCNYYCVQGDVLYCVAKGFNIIQLDTGEIKNYPAPVERSGARHSFGDFMVHNGRVYTQNLTCYVDLETGEYQLLREKETESDSYKNGERSGFSRLFNVDGRLFGLYYADGYHSYYPKGNPELVEILVEDEVKLVQDEEGNIYGEPVVYYSLKRMGETESADEAIGTKENWQAADKTGISEKEKINIKRNLAEMPDCDILPLCYNKAYDAVYYTNFADNSFIYRCKDNEVKLAVKVPADNLYAKDGDIYFRATGTCEVSQNIVAGDICRYTPVTGEVEVIVKNANAVWMTVSDEGINYDVQKEKETVIDGKKYYSRVMNSFCYNFEKKNVEEIETYSGTLLWKDNYGVVPYSPYMVEGSGEGITGLGLYKIGTDMAEVKPIILGARYNDYCIQGDTLYCAGGGGFKIVRLDTGEIKEYSGWTSANGRTSGLGDFMIHNNRVYSSSLMYYIDLETGEAQELKGEAGGKVSRLFNVNDKLYGVYYEKGRRDGNYIGTPEIVEIEVDAEPTLWQEGDWIFGEMVYYRFKKIGE